MHRKSLSSDRNLEGGNPGHPEKESATILEGAGKKIGNGGERKGGGGAAKKVIDDILLKKRG